MFIKVPKLWRPITTVASHALERLPEERRKFWKRMGIVLAALVIGFGGIFGWNYFRSSMIRQFLASMPEPIVTVSAIEASAALWQPAFRTTGSFRAVNGGEVTAEIGGKVHAILFESGQDVKRGDVLVQIDDSVEQANLRGLLANQELAAIDLKRKRQLIKTKATSEAVVDIAEAEFKRAQAAVESERATIAKKKIWAPFDGRLGIRKVELGQYLSAGDPIVSIQGLTPIYLDFSLPQQNVGDVQLGQGVRVTIDTYPRETFEGIVTAISPAVRLETRNFQLQATLANEDLRLRPGMFASVDVLLPERPRVITLPQTAITYNPYGNSVYLVEKQGEDETGPVLRVKRVFVTVGSTRGDQVAIEKGVGENDLVVVAGHLKLHVGSRIQIDNRVLPANDPSPEPKNR